MTDGLMTIGYVANDPMTIGQTTIGQNLHQTSRADYFLSSTT